MSQQNTMPALRYPLETEGLEFLAGGERAPVDVCLLLRTCDAKGRAYGGFQWTIEAGHGVEASDWSKPRRCGSGLHGYLWGAGDAESINWDEDALWYVVAANINDVVDLGGKVKVPRAWVVYCGSRGDAAELIGKYAPTGTAVIGGTATASGVRGTATASGVRGTATASGVRGTATASGVRGTATASGVRGTATASGVRGTATASGYGGTATASGYGGTATASGYGGTATASGGSIEIAWWDGDRKRKLFVCVGEAGPSYPREVDVVIRGVRVRVTQPTVPVHAGVAYCVREKGLLDVAKADAAHQLREHAWLELRCAGKKPEVRLPHDDAWD